MSNALTSPTVPGKPGTAPQPGCVQRDVDRWLISVTFQSHAFERHRSASDDWLVAFDGLGHALHGLTKAMQFPIKSSATVLNVVIDRVNVERWLRREAAETPLGKRSKLSCGCRGLRQARRAKARMGVSCADERAWGSDCRACQDPRQPRCRPRGAWPLSHYITAGRSRGAAGHSHRERVRARGSC